MAKLEKPTLNKSKKPVADAVIGQMIAAEPELKPLRNHQAS